MNETPKLVEPEAPTTTVVADPGGPIHTHTVTAAGIFAVAAGVGLLIAAPHLGAQAAYASSSGIGLIIFGTTGTAFGKSPAIR